MSRRPCNRCEEFIPCDDTRELEDRIRAAIQQGKPWVYRDCQNPVWMKWVMAATFAALVTGAVMSFSFSPWVSLIMLVFAALSLFPLGGLHTTVDANQVQVRLGAIGIPLMMLSTKDIESAEVYQFSPLADFGGYGIRFNREMQAYYFRGNRGVKLATTRGKQYLIGSDKPESLKTVICISRGMGGV
jgi:hypothetical protein